MAILNGAWPADTTRSTLPDSLSDTFTYPTDSSGELFRTGLDTAGRGARKPVTELDRMVVRERRPEGRDETSKPTIVSGDDIRESFRATPLEYLAQRSADVYITSRGTGLHGIASGASGGIHVRGLGGSPNSQVLVVEDGVPDYQGIFGHPIPDAFIPALIDRVVLVKGGDGVLYGTNAMGGVIVVENRWPVEQKTKVSSESAFGSYTTFRQRLCVEKRAGRVAMIAAGNAFTTDGHRAGMEGNSAAGQLGLRADFNNDWSFSVREKIVHLNGNDPGPATHPHTDHWFNVLRNSAIVCLDGKIGDVALVSNVWLNAGEHTLYDGFYSRDYTGGCKVEANGALGEILELIAGIQGNYVDGSVRNRIEKTSEQVVPMTDGALYGQAAVSPCKRLQVVAGGRTLYSDPFGFVPLYKCGIRWELFDTLTLHTHLSRNFRQPTLRELYLPFPTANPDLQPEYAMNVDGGAELRWQKVRLGCTIFRTRATNLIKYFGAWPTAEVVNIDEIKIWGVDINGGVMDIGPVSVEAAYCWQDVGRYTKQNPEAKANATLSVRHNIGGWNAGMEIGAEWVHGLFMNNYRRDPIDDVFFIDMTIRAATQTARGITIEPFAIVRNIADTEYEYIEHYTMHGINGICGINIEL
jgi:outer membrane cobalamin receptor